MFINSEIHPLFYGLLLGGVLSACAGPPQAVFTPTQEKTPEVSAAPSEAAATPEQYSLRTDLLFIPSELPDLTIPPGVGTVSREPEEPAARLDPEGRQELTESFRAGYREALLRDLPLIGVLGGDLVHGWPREDPSVWVQNWRSSRPRPQSWGIPSLLLSLADIGRRRVFTVSGAILDHYGRVNQETGANGAAGYGPPLGDTFP